MNGNTFIAVGNLTKDPELKFIKDSNKPFARFSVADNFSWPSRSGGDRESKVSFIDCVAWGPIAENIANSLSKGDRVVVVGRLDQQNWETEDGERRSKLELDVDSVGPDLRFATATVSKSEFNDKQNSGKRPTRNEPTYGDDEEPF